MKFAFAAALVAAMAYADDLEKLVAEAAAAAYDESVDLEALTIAAETAAAADA